jgi:hypothetical protein
MVISRRRSPSTVNLATPSRKRSISASVKSLIFEVWAMPAASQILPDVVRPMP